MIQEDIDRLMSQYLKSNSKEEEKEEYELEKLSVGMVNYVHRASKSTCSVILKQYKPFLSSAPDIPLSYERYFVEKHSLQAMTGGIEQDGIPGLIASNDDHHVLLITDMEKHLISLFDYLSDDSIRLLTLEKI